MKKLRMEEASTRQPVDFQNLKELLDLKYEQYNRPSFIEEDPISIPHLFSQKEDIEISGFLAATIAWGQRKTIVHNARKLVEMMDMSPWHFVLHADEMDLGKLDSFVHRTFNGIDCRGMILGLRKVYEEDGGLEMVFSKGIHPEDESVMNGIMSAREAISSHKDFQSRTNKHLANPSKGSSAKRLNMFLRWMVRNDGRGVDFGIWKSIQARQLVCPLDVHTGNVSRKLGLLTRKQNDWKSAMELTRNLKQFSPLDPVRYDYSLFGLGIFGDF